MQTKQSNPTNISYELEPLINSARTTESIATRQIFNRDPFLNTLAQRYAGRYGDSINQVINTIEALRSSNFDARMGEVADNLFTAVAEKINADVQGRYSYETEWQQIDLKGQMYFNGRPAIEVYSNAITQANGQIPEFEIARNLANANNLNALEALKSTNRTGYFVEISPSPVLDETARKRGYDGRDSIFVYDLGKAESIPVEQHWFKQTRHEDYTNLLAQVKGNKGTLIGPNQEALLSAELLQKYPDAMLMHNFIYVEKQEDLQPILDFIEQRKNTTSLAAAEIVTNERPIIQGKINSMLPQLVFSARSIIENPDLELDVVLQLMADFIHDQQFGLKEKLLRGANYNTFTQQVRQLLLSENPAEARKHFVAEGCGFSIKESGVMKAANNQGININSKDIPRTSKIFDAHDAVNCPSCGKVFYVKNGESSSYFDRCPHCNSDKVSCK